MSIISISGLLKRYGKIPALKGISFDVRHGEIFALLGPNGSGKTTTLEILMGLRSFNEGEIRYFDAAGQQKVGLKIGPVFQTPVYYDNLTVRELIKYYSQFYVTPSNHVDKYFDLVNLQDKLDCQYKDLSGGQKQQLSILLSLVNDPDILFFDEPSNALDPQIRLKIWDIIRTLKSEGKTIIFTTHYIEEAEALADRVSILSKGEILVTDKPEEIIKLYNDNFKVEFTLEQPVDVESFEQFGVVGMSFFDGVYSFSVDSINGRLMQIVKDMSEKLSISKITIGKSSLEDVFVRLTGEKAAS
ncbi:ABC transporter ATP-binding protein [Rheinheimera maricola]|uniref:ABC transporter ATP-binding protein n=1 Tax=Rheinheimera maricola TaxID=2793282 RepID=A0ABS7XEZ8_9GAMM|nr:ABC transporter ATP-binding protein [Rheinheimera maricola]MBZ9613142.1 ABC transporter ATP-binding protein [Rheinheimera maricola]